MRSTFVHRAFAFAAFAVLASLPVLAAAPGLKPFNAEYVASYMGMEGDARMQLAQNGGQWKYTLRINSSLASLSQSTTFEENDGVWRPLSGEDNSSVLIKKVNKRAQYDWAKGVATWSGDVKPDRAGPVKLSRRERRSSWSARPGSSNSVITPSPVSTASSPPSRTGAAS